MEYYFKKGLLIKKLKEIAKNNLEINFKGSPLITFDIISKNKNIIYDYITARMLQEGFLAKTLFMFAQLIVTQF